MTTLLPVVLGSSLLGSLHCLAMCGPLASMHGSTRSVRLAAAHAVGRLATYVVLGTIAGALGRGLDLAARLGPAQRIATVASGAFIIAWGVWHLGTALGWFRSASAPRLGRFGQGLAQIRSKKPTPRAVLAGMLTGLLPCGWLWAFVISAAGTGSPLGGAVVMAVFWLGTVPAMVGLLRAAGPLLDGLRARMPVITALLLIGVGSATLAMRWSHAGTPTCHCEQRP